jgi:adhesin transport system outer membrane protein
MYKHLLGLSGMVLLALQAISPPAAAQVANLKEAAQKAVLTNPEVQARWHAFKAVGEERDVARGGYYPRADVTAGAGREWLKQPGLDEQDFNRRGAALTLNQMLFDGFATRSEVARLGEARLVRYHELLEASESTALEAGRAYYDVQRYRRLVQLAEGNYAEHRLVFDQIEQRVKAGVGRRADLEQAGGRLALAESNLVTESANLHDVTSRFQRIVGEFPAAQLVDAELAATGLPSSASDAVKSAIAGNPGLKAAVANVRAAQAETQAQRANFMPRLDLRARQEWDVNRDGITGDRTDRVVELVLNYNLFRGGSDMARSRQFAERLNQAKDLRDKTCRDLRQTLAIAYNDSQRLVEQLRYLDQHQLAIEKVREAYRRQFDIGQRTLLDLLDTDNELFQARRAYANGQYDLANARARTHAALGNLLAVLGLNRLDAQAEEDPQADPDAADVSASCPDEVPGALVSDKAAIVAKAMAANPSPRIVPVPAGASASDDGLKSALDGWAAAWRSKDVPAYLAFYAPDFAPTGGLSREGWADQRRQRLSRRESIQLAIDDVVLKTTGKDSASTVFRQGYRSGTYGDVVTKQLDWRRVDGKWKIVAETTR